MSFTEASLKKHNERLWLEPDASVEDIMVCLSRAQAISFTRWAIYSISRTDWARRSPTALWRMLGNTFRWRLNQRDAGLIRALLKSGWTLRSQPEPNSANNECPTAAQNWVMQAGAYVVQRSGCSPNCPYCHGHGMKKDTISLTYGR